MREDSSRMRTGRQTANWRIQLRRRRGKWGPRFDDGRQVISAATSEAEVSLVEVRYPRQLESRDRCEEMSINVVDNRRYERANDGQDGQAKGYK